MPALISELITKVDNFEVVRDQIGAILKVELAHQEELGGKPMPPVFVERSNPWGNFIEGEKCPASLINVWFDSASYDESASNVVERQKCEAVFNVDCYGSAVSVDDGNTVGGHVPGDLQAALEAQRCARLARNILMAGHYTYLGLRGLVWNRFPQTLSMFQPQLDNRAAQRVVVARLALKVEFNEFSPQVQGVELEALSIEVYRAGTGELYLTADYPTPPEE